MTVMWDDPDDICVSLAVEEAEAERSAELAATGGEFDCSTGSASIYGEFDETPDELDEPRQSASPTWNVGGRPLWE